MNKVNPYAAPESSDPPPPSPPGFRVTRLMFPCFWLAFLVLALPAAAPLPIGLRVVSTVITAAALGATYRSVRSWGHLFCAPLYAGLLFVQWAIWFR